MALGVWMDQGTTVTVKRESAPFRLSWLYKRSVGRWVAGLWPLRTARRAGALRWVARSWLKKSVRAMAAGTTATVSVVLGLLSVLIPVYTWALGAMSVGNAIGAGLAMLLIVFLTTIVVARWSLQKLSPEDYAEIALSGLKVSDMLRSVAYEIMVVATRFHDDPGTKWLMHKRQLAPDDKVARKSLFREALKEEVPRFKSVHAALEDLMLGQRRPLQRLAAMKRLVARELGIPPRRLCDYVLRFSPAMFADRVGKFLANWDELVALGRDDSVALSTSRIRGLLAENDAVYRRVWRRRDHLGELFEHDDLHTYIHRFASQHSASGSLRSYARALTHVASGLAAGVRPAECSRRVELLVRTQRAHPGFDLHRQATQLCIGVPRLGLTDLVNVAEDQRRALEYYGNRSDDGRHLPQEEQTHLLALATLFGTVDRVIEESRDQITRRFELLCRRWYSTTPPSSDQLIVVTHGYSKTVREVIKRVLFPQLRVERDKVFLITGKKEESPEAFDTRLMEYELKEEAPWDAARSRRLAISAGEVSLLSKLASTNARVLILLGAEAYDAQGRWVVHPRGIERRLSRLTAAFAQSRSAFRVVVVAEGYKCQPDLLDSREFFEDHLDRVSLYPRDLISLIVSDDWIGTIGTFDNPL